MIKDIFKVELYKVKLTNIDNESLVDYINKNIVIEEGTSNGKSKLNNDALTNDLFKDLNKQVAEHVNKVFHRNAHNHFRLNLNEGWFNKNADVEIITPHKHQHSVYSAVYYPFAIDSQINFQNPASSINYMLDYSHIKNFDEYIGDFHSETVRTGDLIIFKSGLWHWVPILNKNNKGYDRYSVAYNTEIIDESN